MATEPQHTLIIDFPIVDDALQFIPTSLNEEQTSLFMSNQPLFIELICNDIPTATNAIFFSISKKQNFTIKAIFSPFDGFEYFESFIKSSGKVEFELL